MLRHRTILKLTTGKNFVRPVIVFCIILAAIWLISHQAKLDIPQLEVLDKTDQLGFYSHWETRLPKYRSLFMDAAAQHDVDWPLLVAVGYQESKWRADAVSPTGVRGLMMLTRSTAGELGIDDRTKPDQSIYGGAQYLKYLLSRAPEELDDEGKRWFAVSAYNGGINRVKTAYRQWSSIGGIAPNWFDFERDILGASENSALRISMLYTQRVRDFYKMAHSFALAEQ